MRSSSKTPQPTKKPGKLRKLVLGALFFALLLPPSQILLVRWINPSLTTVMIQRKIQYPDWPREHCWIALNQIPESLQWYAILSEDGRFFDHKGIDWEELKSVFETWKKQGAPPRGASTITMQTARSLFLWQGRSYLRKGLECYYAFWMECLLSKQRIFELYLNGIETGPGVYGMSSAAIYHFQAPLDRITKQQQALLIAILPNPIEWSANTPSRQVRRRQKRILVNSQKWKKPNELNFLNQMP
ncbi:MAG: monofunctional biosynthetic peptidoglycan transglycosylase [Verrucomicrobiota bacterium]